MAITGYSAPAQMQLIDTYVPIPFQELAQAGAQKQNYYDQGVAQEMATQDILAQQTGLEQISLPGTGQVTQLGDKEIVKQRTQAYEDRITELSKSYRDKSSPEYRNELKRVVSELRKDIGPEGVFGIAAKNREVEAKLQQMYATNPDAFTYRYADVLGDIKQGIRPDGLSRLQINSTVSKGVDIDEKIGTLMSRIRSISEDPKMYKNYLGTEDLYALEQGEGITYDRAKRIATNLLKQDSEVANEIRLMEKQAKLTGQPFDKQSFIDEMSSNMADIFHGQDKKVSTMWDPFSARAGAGNEPEEEFDYSADWTVDTGKGGITSTASLVATQKDLNDKYQTAVQRYNDYTEALRQNPNLNIEIDPVTGQSTDVSYRYFQLEQDMAAAKAKLEDINRLDRALQVKAGFGNYSEETIRQAKQKALADQKASYLVAQAKADGPYASEERAKIHKEQADRFYTEDKLSFKDYAQYIPDSKEALKTYNKLLKESGSLKADAVKLNSLDKDMKSSFDTPEFKELFKGSDVQWFMTGDSDKTGEVSPGIKNGIDVSKSTLGHWSMDTRPGKGGNLVITLNAKDKDGEDLGKVAMTAPPQVKDWLIRKGKVNPTAIDLKRQLYDQIYGVKNNTGFGTLSLSSGDTSFEIPVVSPTNSTSGKWEAHLPSKTGVNVPFQYNDEASLVKDLTLKYDMWKKFNSTQQPK